MGQAKRRKVLRYLAAREAAGIVGTGPFDLAETLVRLDALMLAGGQRGREAERLAVEVSRHSVQDIGLRRMLEGTAGWSLPWPAWLRRKGQTLAQADSRGFDSDAWPAFASWVSPRFRAVCAGGRVETRTRSFPRGAHRQHDPWWSGAGPWSAAQYLGDSRWVRGERRHHEQRVERLAAKRAQARIDIRAGDQTAAPLAQVERLRSGGYPRSDFADAMASSVRAVVERYGLPPHFAQLTEWQRVLAEATALGLDADQLGEQARRAAQAGHATTLEVARAVLAARGRLAAALDRGPGA